MSNMILKAPEIIREAHLFIIFQAALLPLSPVRHES